MSTVLDKERERLVWCEAEIIALRRVVADAIAGGLDGRRAGLERQIGALMVALTEMDEAGDISQQNAYDHAMTLARARRGGGVKH